MLTPNGGIPVSQLGRLWTLITVSYIRKEIAFDSMRMPRASWGITTSGAGHGGGPSRSALRSRAPCSQAVRELVIWIPAPRCNDRKDEDPALAERFVVSVRVALAERFG